MVPALIAPVLMAHPTTTRPRTRLDGKNPEPFLTATASIATSTSTTFSDRLNFPDEPSSSSSSSTRTTSTSTIKREEKEQLRHSDREQALDTGAGWRELDGKQELDARRGAEPSSSQALLLMPVACSHHGNRMYLHTSTTQLIHWSISHVDAT